MKKTELEQIGKLGDHDRYIVWSTGGISPAITARDYKSPVLVLVEVKSERIQDKSE